MRKVLSIFTLLLSLAFVFISDANASNLVTLDYTNSNGEGEFHPANFNQNADIENPQRGPVRDDPGEDWIFYDNSDPATLTTGVNYWARVSFTPNAEFDLWGVSVMPLNTGPNPNAPCDILVYRENQDNHNLDELVWEGRIDEVRDWDGDNVENNWHWIEFDEDDRVSFEGGERFSIIFGPAPGGDYPGNGEGSGWWIVWDGGSDVNRSCYRVEVAEDHGGWTQIGGDLFIRANGEYTGEFVDLAVTSVYNAEEMEDRRWVVCAGSERNLFAEIANEGAAVEEFQVEFVVRDMDNDVVFESVVDVDGIDEDGLIEVACEDVWEIGDDVGLYTVWVTIDADDDANDENDTYGLDQIVFDQETSRDEWLSFTDGNLEGATNYQPGNGWAIRFDHPGGPIPLWITHFRAAIAAENLEALFKIYIFEIGQDLEDIEIEPEWEGTVQTDANQYVEFELPEEDQITIHDGEGLVVVYYWVEGGTFGSDETPPIAGTNSSMPMSMMSSNGYGEGFSHQNAGDYGLEIKMTGPDHGGVLAGIVTNADDDSPLEGVRVETSQGHRIDTDEEGVFYLLYGPRGEFSVSASLLGYNTSTIDGLELEENDSLWVEFSLNHPEFEPSAQQILGETGLDGNVETSFTVANQGNGTLEYSISKRLIEEAEVEPGAWRESIMAGATVEDSRVRGVVRVNDFYYVAGENDRDPVIYVLNEGGDLVETFPQPVAEGEKMRDLTWDGEYIWGAAQDHVYAIELDGEAGPSFESPLNSISSIAWDPDRQWFWIAMTVRDIMAVDRQGEEQMQIDRQGLRLYGLAYWADDPDGFPLYIQHRNGDELIPAISKCNPGNGQIQEVRVLNHELGGSPESIAITEQYDQYSVVLLSVVSTSDEAGGDRIDIWNLDSKRSWFTIEPEAGEIEAGGSQEFSVNLNAEGLSFDTFEGMFIFDHNASGGEFVMPVVFDVVEGPVWTERTLEMERGWNMVSINLQPDPDDIVEITQSMVGNGSLLLVKDGEGHFYSPEHDFSNLDPWLVSMGYMFKLESADELLLQGITVMSDDPIALLDGWQLISYYPRISVDAMIAFSAISDQLILAKDGGGYFYNPEWDFSNMGDLAEGQGYLVKMDGDMELRYQLRPMEERRAQVASTVEQSTHYLPQVIATGSNMSLLVVNDRGLTGEIGVYSGDMLVGSGVLSDSKSGVAIWGDDPTTSAIEGARSGDELRIVLHDGKEIVPAMYESLQGKAEWVEDSFWVISLDEANAIPTKFGIQSAYPNPFNHQTKLTFNLPLRGEVKLAVFDVNGRQITARSLGVLEAGVASANVDGESFTSGIYFVEVQCNSVSDRMKVVMLK